MAVAAFNCSTSIALYNAHDAAFRQRWKVKWPAGGEGVLFLLQISFVLNFYRLPLTRTFILLFRIPAFHSVNANAYLFFNFCEKHLGL